MRAPKFKNIEEEAEFWDKTDTSEILNTGKPIKVEWESPGKCSKCQTGKLRRRFIDIDLYEGALTLHRIEVHYCPACKETIIPESTQIEIERITNCLQNLKLEEITASAKV
jgi:ribosomal protein L37AE/L43A